VMLMFRLRSRSLLSRSIDLNVQMTCSLGVFTEAPNPCQIDLSVLDLACHVPLLNSLH